MPTRRLPNSVASRLKALKAAKDRKDAVPAPLLIPFTASTITWLDTFYPDYKLKVEAMEAALQAQTNVTSTVVNARPLAEIFISSFYSALQYAIRRHQFAPSVRAYYGLAVSDENLPRIKSEADIAFWGEKASDGEAARIAAGGAPITFPSIAEVNTAVSNFTNPNLVQANAKNAYDLAQEAVEADKADCDKLILKMWNEIETAFDEGDKPSMRRKAREWGVVYVQNAGEAASPNDFSIVGKITDAANGNPLNDVAVLIDATGAIVLTDEQGNYLMPLQPDGNYTLTAYKSGYQTKNIPIVLVAGTVVTLNVMLDAEVPTGSIQGQVFQMGMGVAAKISVEGIPGSVDTDASGHFTLNDIPAGTQSIKATLNSNPAMIQTQMVNVIAGASVNVNFNFM